MDRRSLLRQLLVFAGASPAGGGTTGARRPFDPDDADNPGAFAHARSWLDDWRRLPMQPLHRPEDLADCPDPRIRRLAATLLARLPEGVPIAIRYHGGSEPGTTRTVLPVLLFRKFAPTEPATPHPAPPTARDPIYLLAHCLTKRAPRTFRLDRIHPVHPAEIPG